MNITAQENYIQFDGYRFTKNKWSYFAEESGAFWFQFPGSGKTGKAVQFEDITVDGEAPADRDALIAYLNSNLVFKSGGGTGEGVQSISGDLVDNTDPKNPVVDNPDWSEVSGKPTTFPPAAHTHVIGDIAGLSAGNLIFGGAEGNEQRKLLPSDLGITDSGNRIPVKANLSDTWTDFAFSISPAINSVACRTPTGALRVLDAQNEDEAVTLGQLDARLSPAQRTAINALVSPTSDYSDITEATAAIKAVIDALKAV